MQTIIISIFLMGLFNLASVASGSPLFQVNDKLRNECSVAYALPSKYNFQEVQKKVHSGFSIERRLYCIVPAIADLIESEASLLKERQFYSADLTRPFLLQIFQGFAKVSMFDPDLEIYEKSLNTIVTGLWLIQLLPQVFKDEPLIKALSDEAKKLASLSYMSRYSPSIHLLTEDQILYDFSEVRSSLGQVTLDDAILNRINDQKITELVCVLNPSRFFCPERLLFASDVRNSAEIYISVQKFLRNKGVQLGPKLPNNSNTEDAFCQQVADVVSTIPTLLPTLACASNPILAQETISMYVEQLPNFETLFILAAHFNMDRIRKSLPRGQSSGSLVSTLAKALYLKDAQTALEEMEIYQPTTKLPNQKKKEALREIQIVLKEGPYAI